MIVDDVAAYLAQQGLGIIGTSIFQWFAPNVAGTSITLTPTGGSGDAKHQYDNPTFQVRVRGADSAAVGATAGQIFTLLQSHRGALVVGGPYVVDMQSGVPASMGRDALGRDELVINVRCRVRNPVPGNRY